jgi:hypothetical protein
MRLRKGANVGKAHWSAASPRESRLLLSSPPFITAIRKRKAGLIDAEPLAGLSRVYLPSRRAGLLARNLPPRTTMVNVPDAPESAVRLGGKAAGTLFVASLLAYVVESQLTQVRYRPR